VSEEQLRFGECQCDEEQLLSVAGDLASHLRGGDVIFLSGDLGAGKTTFSRGVLHALGHGGAVKSPTYTLVEPYTLDNFMLYHFDLYRLSDPEELDYIGVRDYVGEHGVCLIEWPEKGVGMLPHPDLCITLKVNGQIRSLCLEACTLRGETMLLGLILSGSVQSGLA
jgi:tRNA threonylcarbamoyladenosine biosynthesis protein TsaE